LRKLLDMDEGAVTVRDKVEIAKAA
jgi:hypothetical protein